MHPIVFQLSEVELCSIKSLLNQSLRLLPFVLLTILFLTLLLVGIVSMTCLLLFALVASSFVFTLRVFYLGALFLWLALILCLISPLIGLFVRCEVLVSLDSIDYWYTQKERLGALLERYEAAGDSFSWDEVYPAYKTACDEYRAAVLAHAPFTGVML